MAVPAGRCSTWRPTPGISAGPRAAGLAGAYVNRYGIPFVDADGSQPEFEVPGLAALADRLSLV
ncbi:MAG: hypothetical protein O3A93_09765 [Chloroflexi bacterium]|nr:hypothetical protein [Chloroflexota bacterium]MDA1271531.1 hypothetical protein [Chloroflexota bacterium]